MVLHDIYNKIAEIKEFWMQIPDEIQLINKAKGDMSYIIESYEAVYDKLLIAVEALNLYKNRSLYSIEENNQHVLSQGAELHAEVALSRIGPIS